MFSVLERKRKAKRPGSSDGETWMLLGEAYVHGLVRHANDDTSSLEDTGCDPSRTFRFV